MRVSCRALSLAVLALVAVARAEEPVTRVQVEVAEDPDATHAIAVARALEAKGRTREAAEAWEAIFSRDAGVSRDAGRCRAWTSLAEVERGHWRSPSEVAEERLRALAPERGTETLPAARAAMERGDACRAVSLLRDAAARAAGPVSPERVLLRARALAESGDDADAEEALLGIADPSRRVSIGGRLVPVGEAASAMLARLPKRGRSSSWGEPGALAEVPPIEGPLVCSREYPLAGRGLCPAVGEGLLALRDGTNVAAIDAASGETRWTTRSSFSRAPSDALFAPVVAEGRVWVVEEPLPAELQPPHLVGLDVRNGRATFDSRAVGCSFLAGASPASAPLVRGRVVYLLATTPGPEEAVHLLAIDVAQVRLLWKTFLFSVPDGPSDCALAEGRGTIYVSSAAGAVLAVDRSNGALRWARTWAAIVSRGAGASRAAGPSQGWAANPLLLEGGRLLVAPEHGEELLVLRAEDGALLAKSPRRGRRFLLGATGDLGYVAGSDVACVDLATGEERWRRECRGKPFARGFVTPTGVYHATEEAIVCLRPEDGALVWGPCTWAAASTPGSCDATLVPVGEGILCVADLSARFAIPRRLFDQETEARLGRGHDEEERILARAEAYARGGFEDDAMADFRAVMAARSVDLAARARRGAFDILAGRAGRLAETRGAREALAVWREALAVSAGPERCLLARVRTAELLERAGEHSAALAAWQEVLDRHAADVLAEGEVRRSGRALGIAGVERERAKCVHPGPSVRPQRAGARAVPTAAREAIEWTRVGELSPIREGQDGVAGPEERLGGEPHAQVSFLPMEGDLFVRQDATIARIDPRSGAVRWMSFLAHAADPRVAEADDAVVVQEVGRVAAIDLATGKLRWEREAADGVAVGGPWAGGGRAVVAAAIPGQRLRIACVDVATGREAWIASAEGAAHAIVQVTSDEVVVSDVVAGSLSVIDLGSGVERFTRRGRALFGGGEALAEATPFDRFILVRGVMRTLRVLDIETGEATWTAAPQADIRALAADAQGVGVCLAGGRLEVLAPADGKVLLDQKLGFEAGEAAWTKEDLVVAGFQGDGWRLRTFHRSSSGSIDAGPGLDLDEPRGVRGFRLLDGVAGAEGVALVEAAGAPGTGSTLTAWRLRTSEALWQAAFPEGRGGCLKWGMAGGVLVAESEGVVRRFGAVEGR